MSSSAARAPLTLLMHPDTVPLNESWFDLCRAKFKDPRVALVSLEDIGCGPMTRPWGRGKPESSFMLLHTRRIRKARHWRFVRHFRFPKWPQHVLDFYTPPVTHRIPDRLSAAGLTWVPMKVLATRYLEQPVYQPPFKPPCWDPELEHLEYGLGNFYAIDGTITHYHNCFDRFQTDVPPDSAEVTQDGIPKAYVRACSERFLTDLRSNSLCLPSPSAPSREPRRIGPVSADRSRGLQGSQTSAP